MVKISKAQLEEMYYRQGMTLAEIGQHFGCSKVAICRKMQAYGLETRVGRREPLDLPREQLVKLYVEEAKTCGEIAAMLGCGETTVVRRMHEYGIELRTVNDYTRFDLPPDELRELYEGRGLSAETIAAHYGCSLDTVLNYLRRYGIAVRPGAQTARRVIAPELYTNWSPDLAYVVGLITSDGYLDRETNSVYLTSTDEELIELFCGCLWLDPDLWPNVCYTPPRDERHKAVYRVGFADPDFRTFLKEVGLTPVKSRTLGPLKVPDRVFRDFLRGCWDGDGCWHIDKWGCIRAHLTSASPPFLAWVQATIARLAGLQGKVRWVHPNDPNSQTQHLAYNGGKAMMLGRWLYYASDIPALSRKRAVWQ